MENFGKPRRKQYQMQASRPVQGHMQGRGVGVSVKVRGDSDQAQATSREVLQMLSHSF
jgi:hypothetical protein